MNKNIYNTQFVFDPEFVKTNPNNFRNYFLVILIILFEDSPFFLLNNKQIYWVIIFSLLLLFNFGRKIIYNRKIFLVILSVWVLIFFQYLFFSGGLTPAALYKPIWVFYTPFLVFTLMGIKYFKYLLNVIYFVAIYTTLIYLLQSFIPDFNDLLLRAFDAVFPYSWADWPHTILIYSAPQESGFFFMRNSGIFHEPGAYSIYLMLAIVINTFFTNRPLNRKNIFLAIVLLSTFSTTGYIMLFVFLCYALIRSKIHFALKPVIIILFAILVSTVYRDSKFLEQKVEENLATQTESLEKGEKSQRGRFYSFGMSVKSFVETPITGRGILTMHKYDVGAGGSFGYGFAGLFAMYGMFFGLFYMWIFYKGFLTMSKFYQMPLIYGVIAFIVINLGLLTQIFFFHTPFIYFFIIGLFLPPSSVVTTDPIYGYRDKRLVM